MTDINKSIVNLEEAKPGYEVIACYELKSGYVFFMRPENSEHYMSGTMMPYLNKTTGEIEAKSMYEMVNEWPSRKIVYQKEVTTNAKK